MDLKKEEKEAFDIPVAKRKYLEEINPKNKKKILLILPILLLLFAITALRFSRNSKTNPFKNFNNATNDDHSILGHLPYTEISKEKLVLIEPNIEVHIDMSESLLQMKKDAKNEGIFLVFLSGYRSINLQNHIFYIIKSKRNQIASERARVSAPPGYSEHSTGFAIDIGDFNKPETDFELSLIHI